MDIMSIIRQKIISIITVVAVCVFCVASPFAASAQAEETKEEVAVTKKVVSELIDGTDNKKLVLEDSVENSSYTIEVQKNTDGTYVWKTSIEINGSVKTSNSLKVKSFSDEFKMDELADIVISGNQAEITNYYENNIVFIEESASNQIMPRAVFLIPLAAGSLTSAAIAALEVSVYSVLTGLTAVAVVDVINDKKSTSSLAYPTGQTTTIEEADISNIPGDFTRSGTKHMEAALTTSIATKLKNDKNNSGDLQIFTNSLNGSNLGKKIMVVYDVKTDATGLINRHLANFVNGKKVKKE